MPSDILSEKNRFLVSKERPRSAGFILGVLYMFKDAKKGLIVTTIIFVGSLVLLSLTI